MSRADGRPRSAAASAKRGSTPSDPDKGRSERRSLISREHENSGLSGPRLYQPRRRADRFARDFGAALDLRFFLGEAKARARRKA